MNSSSALQPNEVSPPQSTRAMTLTDRVRTLPRSFYYCLIGLGIYLTVMKFTTGWRGEQFLGVGAMLFLFFWNDDTRRIGTGIVPLLITVVIYDLTHLTEPLIQSMHLHVHIAEPYNFDRAVFGIPTAAGRLTPNEFFLHRHWPMVDFLTGCSYIAFLYVALAFPVIMCLPRRRPDLLKLSLQFGWTFMIVNLVGYATYYIYPAAPPWYTIGFDTANSFVPGHGFGPPDFSVTASPAAALRWDAFTGLNYFHGFYGRSADIFGAIPSLHVAFPLMVFLFGRHLKKWWFNVLSFSFYALVCFSAVYLEHHYVLDIVLGSAYALTGYAVQQLIASRSRTPYVPLRPAEQRSEG